MFVNVPMVVFQGCVKTMEAVCLSCWTLEKDKPTLCKGKLVIRLYPSTNSICGSSMNSPSLALPGSDSLGQFDTMESIQLEEERRRHRTLEEM